MEQPKEKTDTASPSPGDARETGNLGSSSAIGKRLKAYYDDVAAEPVPDRFLSLLEALDTAEATSKSSKRS